MQAYAKSLGDFTSNNSIITKLLTGTSELFLNGSYRSNYFIKQYYIQGVPGGLCQTSGECSLC
jgi:hypothetical protein